MNGHSFEVELSVEVLLTSFTSFEVIGIFNIWFIVLHESYWTPDRVIQSLIRVVSSNF